MHNLHILDILCYSAGCIETNKGQDFSQRGPSTRENLSSGFPIRSYQNLPAQLQRLARTVKFPLGASFEMILSNKRITKALIRLRGCAGWSAPLLFANPRRQVFSRRRRYYYVIYTILYYTILYYTILYYTILYYTILYYTILYYTILYYTKLYYTILYYTILYYTILYYTIGPVTGPHSAVLARGSLITFY